MQRTMKPKRVLRVVAKLVVIALVGGAAGAGLGVGLAALTKDPATSQLAPAPLTGSAEPEPRPAARSAPSRTSTAPISAARALPRARRRPQASRTARVRVLAAVLHPAATASGKRRQRARLTVHLRVTNGTGSVLTPARPTLLGADAVAGKVVGGPGRSLGDPLQPLASAQGKLRFETVGAITRRIVSTRRVRLRFAGRTVVVAIEVGRPVARSKRANAPDPKRKRPASSSKPKKQPQDPPAPTGSGPPAPPRDPRPAIKRSPPEAQPFDLSG